MFTIIITFIKVFEKRLDMHVQTVFINNKLNKTFVRTNFQSFVELNSYSPINNIIWNAGSKKK